MEVIKNENGDVVTYIIKGRLDTNTSPELMSQLELDGKKEVIFDLKDVDYVFSAGLRVFLQVQKIMSANQGKMKIIHAQDSVKEIFNIVGFSNIMDIE